MCIYDCQVRREVAYANSKGIEVGAYDLIALTRGVPEYWRAVGGDGACMASNWYVIVGALSVWSLCILYRSVFILFSSGTIAAI